MTDRTPNKPINPKRSGDFVKHKQPVPVHDKRSQRIHQELTPSQVKPKKN